MNPPHPAVVDRRTMGRARKTEIETEAPDAEKPDGEAVEQGALAVDLTTATAVWPFEAAPEELRALAGQTEAFAPKWVAWVPDASPLAQVQDKHTAPVRPLVFADPPRGCNHQETIRVDGGWIFCFGRFEA
jgi:hypothetical protein